MKTLQGTITVLKDKEGNIKIPRTTASAVQFVSGKTLESAIQDIYSKSEIDTMFANLTLNGEVILGTYAAKEYVDNAIETHAHSYNELTDKPEVLPIEEAVSKEYLELQLKNLHILDSKLYIFTDRVYLENARKVCILFEISIKKERRLDGL